MRITRSRILRTWGEFQLVRRKGKSVAGPLLVLGVLAETEGTRPRFGFITSKRVGNAVTRNRVRRRLKAIATEWGDALAPDHLLVTVARRPAADASFGSLRGEWIALAKRAGVLHGDSSEAQK